MVSGLKFGEFVNTRKQNFFCKQSNLKKRASLGREVKRLADMKEAAIRLKTKQLSKASSGRVIRHRK
jgi:hypothetical protein